MASEMLRSAKESRRLQRSGMPSAPDEGHGEARAVSGPGRSGVPVILSLGSNVGDRRGHLSLGLRRLLEVIRLEAVSRVVESAAWGPVPQSAYLNVLVRGRSPRGPRALLRQLQAIEREAGRVREVRFGPRTLDVDLVFFGTLQLETPDLTVPHPHWKSRAFVYGLLGDVAGDMVDPGSGRALIRWAPDGSLPEGLAETTPLDFEPDVEGERSP